jgi:hypothetical protein
MSYLASAFYSWVNRAHGLNKLTMDWKAEDSVTLEIETEASMEEI